MSEPSFPNIPAKDSGIHIIIIGLGIVGLAAAIECREKGHTVTAYEKSDILAPVGDSVGLASNSARIVKRWGDGKMHQAIDPWVTNARFINIHNASGKRILKQDLSDVIRETNYLIPRYQLVRAMYDYAKQIGVDIHLGWQVSSVRDDWGSAHIEIESSGHKHKVSGDCVICCDGVHSKSRDVVSGQSGAPRPSGYAAFRALIDGTKLADDPEARWILEGAEQTDRFEVFFAPNAQMAIQSCNKGKDITWFCIHKDSRNLPDVWTSPANAEEMFDLIKHWPIVRRLWPIVRHTPRDKFINYPLFDHSPLSRWVSTGGRVILIGDAAHPLSPAAGQGASQGIEDANVVALCLQLAGKTQVPLGLRVAERLRYPRAAVVQLVSQAANESWQQHPWDNYENGQETIASLPLQDWIFKHDSQSHTFAEFEVVAESLRRGQAYVPSNVPVALLKHLRSKEALPRASRM